MATPTYELIETTTLSSDASSVTFSSITQDYRDLVLVFDGEIASGTLRDITFNEDNTSTYSAVQMRGDGSSASSSTFSETYLRPSSAALGIDQSNQLIMNIMDYSATDKHKTVLLRANIRDVGRVTALAGRWPSTSAITQIRVGGEDIVSIKSGTTVSLYGIAS